MITITKNNSKKIHFLGISFCGADIGGFFGEPEEELFIRWNQAAAFTSFFRNHASKGTKYREPWMFSEKTLNLSRNAIMKRYQFLPLWYTLFYEHEVTGVPVMRPMLSQYPRDRNVLNLETQFMLGDKLLVAPVLTRGANVVIVYFPSNDGNDVGDVWYDIDTYEKYNDVGYKAIEAKLDKIPVFQRGGTIIAKKMEVKKSSVFMRYDPYSVYVAVDKQSSAEGTLYNDDEISFEYRDKNSFDYLHFQFSDGSLAVHPMMENYNRTKFDKIYFAGLQYTPPSATFICRATNSSTELDSKFIHANETQQFFHIDIASFECDDYSWTLRLNGSMRSAVGGGVLAIAMIFHIVKHFL